MVTRASKAKPHIRRSTTHQKLEEGAWEIIKDGEILALGQNRYHVSSMSSDKYHEVSYDGGLWRCDCDYYTSGHALCKHTYAARARAVTQDTAKQELKTVVEMPERHCPKCKSHESSESFTYDSKSGERQVYSCDDCKHRFTFRPGFKYRQFSDDLITDVLVDAGAGHPPGRIVERLAKRDIKISERTIQRWIKDYAELIELLTSTLRYNLGDKWSLDEKHIQNYPADSPKKSKRTKKDGSYVFAALDNLTRMVLACEVDTNKSGYDATGLLKAAIIQAGSVPNVVIADGLSGYKKGFVNSVLSLNPDAVLVADVGINGKHINNNKRERLNGEIKDCLSRARGFRSKFPGLVRLTILYHNFIHKNKRDRITPAEAAGVHVAGPDIFMTLIRNAALMGT